jgi:hypothetical protein
MKSVTLWPECLAADCAPDVADRGCTRQPEHLKLQAELGNGNASAQGTTPENDPGTRVGLAYQFEY